MDTELFRRSFAVPFLTAKGVGDVAGLHRLQGRAGARPHPRRLTPEGELRRQVIELDDAAPAQNETMLDDVLELAGVAREVMAHQQGQDNIMSGCQASPVRGATRNIVCPQRSANREVQSSNNIKSGTY